MKAKNLEFALPAPPVICGFFYQKDKGIYLWCMECKRYFERVTRNPTTWAVEGAGGSCPHYNGGQPAAASAPAGLVAPELAPEALAPVVPAAPAVPAPSAEIIIPDCCKSYQNAPQPNADQRQAAEKAAVGRHTPEPTKPVIFGYFDKHSKGIFLYCETCRVYIDRIKFNGNVPINESEGGRCPHYDAKAYDAVRARALQ